MVVYCSTITTRFKRPVKIFTRIAETALFPSRYYLAPFLTGSVILINLITQLSLLANIKSIVGQSKSLTYTDSHKLIKDIYVICCDGMSYLCKNICMLQQLNCQNPWTDSWYDTWIVCEVNLINYWMRLCNLNSQRSLDFVSSPNFSLMPKFVVWLDGKFCVIL